MEKNPSEPKLSQFNSEKGIKPVLLLSPAFFFLHRHLYFHWSTVCNYYGGKWTVWCSSTRVQQYALRSVWTYLPTCLDFPFSLDSPSSDMLLLWARPLLALLCLLSASALLHQHAHHVHHLPHPELRRLLPHAVPHRLRARPGKCELPKQFLIICWKTEFVNQWQLHNWRNSSSCNWEQWSAESISDILLSPIRSISSHNTANMTSLPRESILKYTPSYRPLWSN